MLPREKINHWLKIEKECRKKTPLCNLHENLKQTICTIMISRRIEIQVSGVKVVF
jgi:hypothetical protein